jgi:DNA-binding NarL/FixJ family response regulator
MRVLVVDQPIIVLGLMTMFQNEADLELCCAHTIESGFSMFLHCRPDVTIAELSLPDGSGVELTQKIRATDSRARIILLGMSDDPIFATRAKQIGAHAYFTKSGEPYLLLRAVLQLKANCSQSQLTNATQ